MLTHDRLLVVAGALCDARGRVLVQQRPPGKSLAGLWEFPGGKVESGESSRAALIRELREELGIAVTIDALSPIAFAEDMLGERTMLLLLFRVAHWEGIPRPLYATALLWETIEGLRSLPMPPADYPMLDSLE